MCGCASAAGMPHMPWPAPYRGCSGVTSGLDAQADCQSAIMGTTPVCPSAISWHGPARRPSGDSVLQRCRACRSRRVPRSDPLAGLGRSRTAVVPIDAGVCSAGRAHSRGVDAVLQQAAHQAGAWSAVGRRSRSACGSGADLPCVKLTHTTLAAPSACRSPGAPSAPIR